MVERYYDPVWRTLKRLGVPEAAADDAAQQVFMVAANRLSEIDPQRERQYVFGISLKVASDTRRAVMRRREVPHESAPSDGPVASSPEELFDQKETHQALVRLLEKLPTELREAFVLFEIEELTAIEISEMLGIPVGTVASRVRRARQYIRERLAPQRAS